MIVRGVRASLPSAALAGLVLAVTGCDGKGELNCPAGQTACSGVCVDAASARDNCLCGFQCPTGAACTTAGCQCPADQTVCGAACASLSTDPLNCGACGHRCGAGTCSGTPPSCTCNASPILDCGPSASPQCVNGATDSLNCGACGHLCGLGTCGNGICTCAIGPGFIFDCGVAASPQCVDTLTDPNNCGGCGAACSSMQHCSFGFCCGIGLIFCGITCEPVCP